MVHTRSSTIKELNMKISNEVKEHFSRLIEPLVTNESMSRILETLRAEVFEKFEEKLVEKQITAYIENISSPYICVYRKGFSTQNALVLLIERWKKELDKKGYSGAISMDLSKAFDTINHELLIAKINAYGFSENGCINIKLLN